MATFTFDTAYIVAHLQNNANQRTKQRILDRVRDHRAYNNFLDFEITCSLLGSMGDLRPETEEDRLWFSSDWVDGPRRSISERLDDLVASWEASRDDEGNLWF